jgi:DNA-binding NarL/FixJ family response regulator
MTLTEIGRKPSDAPMNARLVHGGFAEYFVDDLGAEAATLDAAIERRARNKPGKHIGVLVLALYSDCDSVLAAVHTARTGLEHMECGQFCGSFQPAIRMFSELTGREREILTLIARGRRNQEIATQLCLSIKTVRNHASNIFSKLQVVDRAQAAIRARAAGLA